MLEQGLPGLGDVVGLEEAVDGVGDRTLKPLASDQRARIDRAHLDVRWASAERGKTTGAANRTHSSALRASQCIAIAYIEIASGRAQGPPLHPA